MNSELLAQMKNKLIKLKQPSAQPQPTPPNDPRPPQQPSPPPQPSHQSAQQPQTTTNRPPSPPPAKEPSLPKDNNDNPKSVLSEKLLMLQQMKAKRQSQKAQQALKELKESGNESLVAKEKQQDQKGQQNEGERSQQSPKKIDINGDEDRNIGRQDKVEVAWPQKKGVEEEIKEDMIGAAKKDELKEPNIDELEDKQKSIQAQQAQHQVSLQDQKQSGEVLAEDQIDRGVVDNYQQEGVLIERVDQGQERIMERELQQDLIEAAHQDILQEGQPQQLLMERQSPLLQREERPAQQNQQEMLAVNEKHQPAETVIQPQSIAENSNAKANRLSLMMQKMRLMRSQLASSKVVQEQAQSAPRREEAAVEQSGNEEKQNLHSKEQENEQMGKKGEEQEQEQGHPAREQLSAVGGQQGQQEVEKLAKVSKLYQKQRKIYLKEVQNIVRVAGSLKTQVGTDGVAEDKRPKAVGLVELSARLRDIVNRLIPN